MALDAKNVPPLIVVYVVETAKLLVLNVPLLIPKLYNEKLLLIERAKFPFGFALPAGHVDDDKSYEESAIRELREEVGLFATDLELILEGRKENHCRRDDGTWHYWKIYKIIVDGDINRSKEETKQVGWYTKDQIKNLAKRTQKYNNNEITENKNRLYYRWNLY